MQNRRKAGNYFPQPKFQFRFVRFLLFGATLHMTATCGIIYVILNRNYQLIQTILSNHLEASSILQQDFSLMVSLIGLTFFGYLMGITILGVLYSHKAVGIIVAIERTINEILSGHDSKLKLRKDDDFQEMASSFNKMVSSLRNEGVTKSAAS